MSGNNFSFKRKYGRPAKSNIRWGYNFDPLTKILLIVLSVAFLGSFWMLLKERRAEKIEPFREEQVKVTENNTERENEIKALEGILRDIRAKNRGQSQDIYVWNENGRVRASNVNHPVENEEYQVIEGIASTERETKYIKRGGSILLPVTIGNNGKAYKVNMILDTGCSITMLDAEVSAALNFQTTSRITTTIADGSRRIKGTGTVDFFQVGPFRENDFFISTGPVLGRNKTNYGLLGMNFLEKHPFTIDHRRKVIVWQ